MNKENILQIHLVETDKGCFITDKVMYDSYSITYHRSSLKDLYFDGKNPEPTFYPNWLKIEKYPVKIQGLQQQPSLNNRYELLKPELASDKLPLVIKYKDANDYDECILSLYEFKNDKQEPILVDVKYEIIKVMEVENFEEPIVIDYKAIKRDSFKDITFNITNLNIKHQIFDKIIFPEIMLHTRPCSISSHDLYCLVRQYIRDNIDTKVAKITSDYDFCFTVKKIIPLIEPEKFSYQNLLARTKKERNRIHYATHTYKEVEIFEMTHEQAKYNNYTVIQPIFADNELELKNKIDEFLNNLMTIINHPLELCSYCNGTGYIDEIKKIKQEDLSK